MNNKSCKQCGECCKKSYITLNEDDFQLWEDNNRYDILEVADILMDYMVDGERFRCGDGFWRKGSDEPTPDGSKTCLFLMFQPHVKKFICRIHDVKPEICRNYYCRQDKGSYETYPPIKTGSPQS